MVYNLDTLWRRSTEDGPIPLSTALLALAFEFRALRRMLQPEPEPPRRSRDEDMTEETKIGGSA